VRGAASIRDASLSSRRGPGSGPGGPHAGVGPGRCVGSDDLPRAGTRDAGSRGTPPRSRPAAGRTPSRPGRAPRSARSRTDGSWLRRRPPAVEALDARPDPGDPLRAVRSALPRAVDPAAGEAQEHWSGGYLGLSVSDGSPLLPQAEQALRPPRGKGGSGSARTGAAGRGDAGGSAPRTPRLRTGGNPEEEAWRREARHQPRWRSDAVFTGIPRFLAAINTCRRASSAAPHGAAPEPAPTAPPARCAAIRLPARPSRTPAS